MPDNDIKQSQEIYLDAAATTSVSPETMSAITKYFKYYGNPSSIYSIGQQSKSIIRDTKKHIGKLINCKSDEIIFTASGSESDNLALKGFYFAHTDDCTIITSNIEHKAILNSCAFMGQIGATIKYVNVDSHGRIDVFQLEELCKDSSDTLLVSIQFANNEIGTIQDIKTISHIVHKYNGVFHTDAVQAFPEMRIDVQEYGIDMMSVSGHKFCVPKGIGFLYKRSGIEIEPLIHGGQQEFGLRAGTENVPYIAGLDTALSMLPTKDDITSLKSKRDYFIKELTSIQNCILNGSLDNRLANNINVSFKDIEGEALLMLLDMNNIYVSAGSACNSRSLEASYVLRAIGVDNDYIHGTIRISINNNITYEEIDNAVKVITDCVDRLRIYK